jgi:hypothetical protein
MLRGPKLGRSPESSPPGPSIIPNLTRFGSHILTSSLALRPPPVAQATFRWPPPQPTTTGAGHLLHAILPTPTPSFASPAGLPSLPARPCFLHDEIHDGGSSRRDPPVFVVVAAAETGPRWSLWRPLSRAAEQDHGSGDKATAAGDAQMPGRLRPAPSALVAVWWTSGCTVRGQGMRYAPPPIPFKILFPQSD